MYASPLAKGSDILLQYPINVRPENIAIPPIGDVLHTTDVSFTFQGDYLSYVLYRCIDCATNEIVYDSVGGRAISRTPIAYNGDEVAVGNLATHITSGHNYVIQFLLSQKTQDGEDNLYDMPCISGTITATTGTQNSFVLENNLPIYEWSSTHQPIRDRENVVAVGMVMKIGDETRFITDYNPTDGVVSVYSPFTSEVKAGTRYKIYSNYLITPQYYFKCRDLPTISASIEIRDGGVANYGNDIHCSATYVQQDNSMIKYYIARLYASYHGLTNEYLLAETPKIYSQNIDYTFLNATLGVTPWGDEILGNIPFDVDYSVEFEIVTQDNEIFSANATMRVQSTDEDFEPIYDDIIFTPNKNTGCVDMRYVGSGSGTLGAYILTRIDLETGEKVQVLEDAHDYGVAANARYEYQILYYNINTGQPYIKLDGEGKNIYGKSWRVETSELDGYTITALTPIKPAGEYIENWYKPQDTWHFICDIEDTTMTHNYDKHLQVGYGRYPAMTSTETDYLTSTLTAMLGKINCGTKEFEDTIALVKAWRKFISQPCPFLLKSPKGDIWIVNITDASTSYDESTPNKYTTFSFSWAECDSIDNAILYRGTWS